MASALRESNESKLTVAEHIHKVIDILLDHVSMWPDHKDQRLTRETQKAIMGHTKIIGNAGNMQDRRYYYLALRLAAEYSQQFRTPGNPNPAGPYLTLIDHLKTLVTPQEGATWDMTTIAREALRDHQSSVAASLCSHLLPQPRASLGAGLR